MKPNSNWKVAFLILAVLLILFLIFLKCCGQQKTVLTDPVKAPIAFSFLKAKAPFDEKVANVQVFIHDPSGQLVTSNGLPVDQLMLEYGVMCLAFKQDAVISEEKPYRFTVHALADGFVENVKTFLITSEQPQYHQLFLAELEDAPNSLVTAVSNNFALDEKGALTAPIQLSTTFANGDTASLSFPQGLSFYCEGKPITNFDGSTKASLAVGTPDGSLIASEIFPNGINVIDAIDRNGERIADVNDPFFFTSYGWATIELQLGEFRVDSFSAPIPIRIPIFPMEADSPIVVFNAIESSSLEENISVWTLNEKTGAWQEEFITPVESSGGSTYAAFDITHLSTWNLDLKGPDACRATDHGPLTIEYTNTTCPQVLYSRLVFDDPNIAGNDLSFVPKTPTGAGLTQSYNLTYLDTDVSPTAATEITIANYPNSSSLEFRVYTDAASAAADINNNIASTAVVSGCQDFDGPDAIDAIDLAIPVAGGTCDVINLNFDLNISGGGDVTVPICNNAVWFKVIPNVGYALSDDDKLDEWSFAGIIDASGNLTTSAFDFNPGTENVRLLIWWHSSSFDQSVRFTLPDQASTFNNCGVLGASATQVSTVNLPGGGSGTPVISLASQCFRNSGSATTTCATTGYSCTTQANSATERGLVISITDLPAGFTIPACPPS